jgi:hypothetical protein
MNKSKYLSLIPILCAGLALSGCAKQSTPDQSAEKPKEPSSSSTPGSPTAGDAGGSGGAGQAGYGKGTPGAGEKGSAKKP